MALKQLGPFNFHRVMQSVSELEERLHRVTSALESAKIPYAVVGGNAVASWVSRVDPEAIRCTKDVDLLMRNEDIVAAGNAVKDSGFIYRHAAGIDFFLDGPAGRFTSAVHIVKANEKVREEYLLPAPDVTESEISDEGYHVVSLEALVRMKLTSFRIQDQVHLQDLCRIGLVDSTWTAKFIPELGTRLQQILDSPDSKSELPL
jgi:hypothetical protein